MRRLRHAAVLLNILLAACASRIEQKENLLVAAGFQFRPADTPERTAALKRLPAHRFVRQVRDGKPVWIYADPTICGCLYAGNEQAYQTYRQEVFQKRLANERERAAQMNEDAAMEQVQWEMWGPWAPFYY
jgi:hypothetical protein